MTSGRPSLGLCVYNFPAPLCVEIARAAETAGFDAVWFGEHIVLPTGYGTAHPTVGATQVTPSRPVIDVDTDLVDPMVGLAAAAATTSSIALGTGIYLLPLRHPLATARAAISLQEIAGGRFTLGVGAGWLREEFAALEVPFAERNTRLDEAIAVLRAVTTGGPASFDGEHYRFTNVQLCARAVTVPIVLGGNSERALRRAVLLADGWMSSGFPSPDEAGALVARIAALHDELGIDRAFDIHLRLAGSNPEDVARYRDVGIDNVMFYAEHVLRDRSPESVADTLGELVTNVEKVLS
jgi:probable F420-dependent oxidoreductase